ncbi:MAG: GNAT family N-acetyltransferase [Thermoleophilia bacterium]|nr:GNAT family N-acetyltransferase [Thermoleophilia bacterium]
MNELERIEADAYAIFCELAGGTVTRLDGGVCLSTPLPATELNRVTNVSEDLDLDAVADVYRGKQHLVSVPAWEEALVPRLEARGYAPGYAWMKFERAADPAEPVDSSLRIEETDDGKLFGVTASEGFSAPPEAAPGFDVTGRPGWHCFIAWDGDEPAAAASLFVQGELAWFGGAATRPAFRGRGAQRALLAARVERARAVGARRLSAETGHQVEGRPDQSYRNIVRAGFRESYLRPNWRSPE